MPFSHRGKAGRLVSVRIVPLRLAAFEQLPKHARRCVFWEVDPATLSGGDYLRDPEFEKEAWLSDGHAGWGRAARSPPRHRLPPPGRPPAPTTNRPASATSSTRRRVVPAPSVSTGPVSADAVLLTSMGVEPGHADDLPHALISQVVSELIRRGVRAMEAFGRTAEAAELAGATGVDPELQPVVDALGDCSVEQCMIDADFLIDAGSPSSRRTATFPGFASSSTRVSAGRRRWRRPWSGCWRVPSRSGPARRSGASRAAGRPARPTARARAARRR